MTVISRLGLDHPALGAAGGSALHAQIAAMFTKLGDNTNARYVEYITLAHSEIYSFVHNFHCSLSAVRYDIYTIASGNLTLVTDMSQWAVTELNTTTIRFQNNTGSSTTVAIVMMHDPIGLDELTDVATAGASTGKLLRYNGTQWVPVDVAALAETLSNKTILQAVVDDYLDLNEESTPSTPASGKVRLFAKADGRVYIKDDTGAELPVGGSGSGEINVVDNPSDANAGWTNSGASSAVTTTQVAAELPLGGVIDTAIKVLTTEIGEQVAYRFQLPPALRNRKLKVEWHQLPGTLATSSLVLDVRSNTASNYGGTWARMPLSTDVSSVTGIVPSTGKFTCSFDADGSTYYELRFYRNGNASSSQYMFVANVIVGPGIQAQGAVVTSWEAYTGVVSGITLNATAKVDPVGKMRRVGDTLEVALSWANGSGGAATGSTIGLGLPSGLTVNTGALPPPVMGDIKLGSAETYNATIGGQYDRDISIILNGGTVRIIKPGTGGLLAGTDFPASSEFSSHFRVPIAEWAGSGTMSVLQDETLTEAQTYTPTFVGLGTVTVLGSEWKRVGGAIRCRGRATLGTTTAVTATMTLPTGLTTRLPSSNNYIVGSMGSTNATNKEFFVCATNGSNTVFFNRQASDNFSGSGVVGTTVGASTESISWDFEVDITEWRGKSNGAVGFAMADIASAGLVSSGTQTFGGPKTVSASTNSLNYGASVFTINSTSSTAAMVLGVAGSRVGGIYATTAYPFCILNGSGTDVAYANSTGQWTFVGGSQTGGSFGSTGTSITLSVTNDASSVYGGIVWKPTGDGGSAEAFGLYCLSTGGARFLEFTHNQSEVAKLSDTGVFTTAKAIQPGGSGGMPGSSNPQLSSAVSSNLTTGNYAALGGSSMFGLMMILGSTSGDVTLIALRGGAGVATVVYTTGTVATTDSGAGEAIYWSGSEYRWKNRSGATRNYQFLMIGQGTV